MDEFKRMIQKFGSGIPTIPPSTDHRNGDWLDTDLYEGEIYMNTDSGVAYTRNGSDIIEFKSGLVYQEAVLGQTELFNLNTASTTVKASLGTDEYYEPECLILEYTFGTTAYTLTDYINVEMGGQLLARIPSTFITGTGATPKKIVIIKDFVNIIDVANVNAHRSVYNISLSSIIVSSLSDASVGDGEIKVKMWTIKRTFG